MISRLIGLIDQVGLLRSIWIVVIVLEDARREDEFVVAIAVEAERKERPLIEEIVPFADQRISIKKSVNQIKSRHGEMRKWEVGRLLG